MNLRPLLFLPPLAIGVLGFLWLTASDPAEDVTAVEAITVVRTQPLAMTSLTPSASGFGRVTAEETWSAISQVQGRASFVADRLAIGSIVPAGTEIVRVDPRDYEISLARAVAARASAVASLDELNATEENTKATIELEERILDLREEDVARQRTLLDRGSVPQTALDNAIRDQLSQEKVILNLRNTLRLLPAQRASLDATVKTRTVEIEEAERALSNTVFSTPMKGRVTAKSVSTGQFVRSGDTLTTIESTQASEIVAEFQTRVLGNFFSILLENGLDEKFIGLEITDASEFLTQVELNIDVRLQSGDESFFWPAEIVRFDGSADAATGTLGLVVRVENPSLPRPENPGPPLSNGAFVEVILSAPEPVPALRVPRSAIHTDGDVQFVYLADDEDRLARQIIETGSTQNDLALVQSGLEEGARIVLSDPRPAIIGMKLDPVEQDRVAAE